MGLEKFDTEWTLILTSVLAASLSASGDASKPFHLEV